MTVDLNEKFYPIGRFMSQDTFYVAFDIVINFIIIEHNNNLMRCRVSNQIFVCPSHMRSYNILKYLKDFGKGFNVRMW